LACFFKPSYRFYPSALGEALLSPQTKDDSRLKGIVQPRKNQKKQLSKLLSIS